MASFTWDMGISSTMGVMPCACANESISRIVARLPRKEPVIDSWCATRSVELNATSGKPTRISLPAFLQGHQQRFPVDLAVGSAQ